MDNLKRALADSLRRAIRSQLPDAFDDHPVELMAEVPDEPLLIAMIHIKTSDGGRYFVVRLQENY